jgi:hypothetical protein
MAIGQLADYRRFVGKDATSAVLVPERPRHDLLSLLESQGIEAIWPTPHGFEDTTAGRLVGSVPA